MDKEAIQSAVTKLSLLDIYLWDSDFERGTYVDARDYPAAPEQQSRLSVETQELTISFHESNSTLDVLRVLVTLGIRAVPEDLEEPTEHDALFKIEATFAAEYLISDTLSEEEIGEFSTHNAVHNVWPFWRNHVFSTVNNASLPKMNVPLLRGVPGPAEKGTSTKKKPRPTKTKPRSAKRTATKR